MERYLPCNVSQKEVSKMVVKESSSFKRSPLGRRLAIWKQYFKFMFEIMCSLRGTLLWLKGKVQLKVRLVVGMNLILRYVCETMPSLKDLLFERQSFLNIFDLKLLISKLLFIPNRSNHSKELHIFIEKKSS